ncbi:MAG TPA: hemin uptake protein HemP [Burkholderiales bacterium]|nr:hemin uptake protein HemP [Burkholderiales bacterium]
MSTELKTENLCPLPPYGVATGAQASPAQSTVSSETLLGPQGELVIEHRGRAYRLRITQSGKLILTA